jgi:hypothetical protein
MKTRIFSGIETEHLIRSAIYLVVAAILVAYAFPAEVLKGSSLGVLLFNIGLIFFFFALMHPWGNARYYFIQFVVLFLIFSVLQIAHMILELKLTEDIMWLTGGICIDGFIGVIAGIIVFSEGSRCLLYSAASVALLAIFIMFPQALSPDLALKYSTVLTAYIFLIFQFGSVAVFFRISSIEESRSRGLRILILISGIILILMGVYGILVFKTKEWLFGIHIWSILEIISGLLAVYAVAYPDENQA